MAEEEMADVDQPYTTFHLKVVSEIYRKLNPVVGTNVHPESGATLKTLSLTVPIVYYGRRLFRGWYRNEEEELRTVKITIYIPQNYPFGSMDCFIDNIHELDIRTFTDWSTFDDRIQSNGRLNIVIPTTDRSPGYVINNDLMDYVKHVVPWIQGSPLIVHKDVKLRKRIKCDKIHLKGAKCQLYQ